MGGTKTNEQLLEEAWDRIAASDDFEHAAPLNRDELGQIAYEAFRASVLAREGPESAVTYPTWDAMPEGCKEANRAAADAVRQALIIDPNDERKHRPSLYCVCPACVNYACKH